MSNGDLNWITNFIWGIADDALRDLYVRGKYRDVILPMVVVRRLDAVLEPTKKAVLAEKGRLDRAGVGKRGQSGQFDIRPARSAAPPLWGELHAFAQLVVLLERLES